MSLSTSACLCHNDTNTSPLPLSKSGISTTTLSSGECTSWIPASHPPHPKSDAAPEAASCRLPSAATTRASFRWVGRGAHAFYRLHRLWFTSMPRLDTRKSRSFPAGTANTHFSGLSLSWVVCRLSKASDRSRKRVYCCRVLTVDVCFDIVAMQVLQGDAYGSLECRPMFLSPKGMQT